LLLDICHITLPTIICGLYLIGIAESVSELSAKAQFHPSTTKTLNSDPKQSKSVRLCPRAHAVASHRRRPLRFPSGRTWHLARPCTPHPSLALVLQGTEGTPGSAGHHGCHCRAGSRGGGATRQDAAAPRTAAARLLVATVTTRPGKYRTIA
jgi:hypothetical protein